MSSLLHHFYHFKTISLKLSNTPEVQTLRHGFHNLGLPSTVSPIRGSVCEGCVVERGGPEVEWKLKIK